ncbi:unnamed protein product, partial [Nesidiocoris tenuis]
MPRQSLRLKMLVKDCRENPFRILSNGGEMFQKRIVRKERPTSDSAQTKRITSKSKIMFSEKPEKLAQHVPQKLAKRCKKGLGIHFSRTTRGVVKAILERNVMGFKKSVCLLHSSCQGNQTKKMHGSRLEKEFFFLLHSEIPGGFCSSVPRNVLEYSWDST